MPEVTSIHEEGQTMTGKQTSHCIFLQSRMHAMKDQVRYRLKADSVLQLKFIHPLQGQVPNGKEQ